eukprot:6182212-Pleurochrysis_carterae.AAC.1
MAAIASSKLRRRRGGACVRRETCCRRVWPVCLCRASSSGAWVSPPGRALARRNRRGGDGVRRGIQPQLEHSVLR